MVNLLKCCLCISYFSGRATGLLNFEIDLKTGRVKVTKRATICAACLHILLFISMAYHLINLSTKTHAQFLRQKVYLVKESTRIICAVLVLVSRWTQRGNFIRLYNSLRRLYEQNPEIGMYCQRSIVGKSFFLKMAEMFHVIVTLYLLRNQLTIPTCIEVLAIFNLTVLINGITTQYFIAMASIRAKYIILNKDLKAVLAEAHSLNPNRRGVFVTTCCSLADRLEQLAKSQSDLQVLTEWLMRTYEVQVVCMVFAYYLNMVGNFYTIFSFAKNWGSIYAWPKFRAIALTTFTVFYFIDCWVNLFNAFHLLDAHDEMVQLLSERTVLQPGLDQRLEAVIDNFTLNLARNSFNLKFFGLFKINRFVTFALLNSLLTHTIILIQYDIENS